MNAWWRCAKAGETKIKTEVLDMSILDTIIIEDPIPDEDCEERWIFNLDGTPDEKANKGGRP